MVGVAEAGSCVKADANGGWLESVGRRDGAGGRARNNLGDKAIRDPHCMVIIPAAPHECRYIIRLAPMGRPQQAAALGTPLSELAPASASLCGGK